VDGQGRRTTDPRLTPLRGRALHAHRAPLVGAASRRRAVAYDRAAMTGHAHHFLQRLDRLSMSHVELALSLYNDVPMLRFILDETRVPERVERAAICLGAPEEGPHVIVSREGRFITALGEGMKPYDAHVVSRADLDFIAGRVSAIRERMKVSEQTLASGGRLGAIFKKIMEAGPRFAREDFQAIAGLHPWLRKEFLHGMFGCGTTCLDLREILSSPRHISRPQREERLKLGWDAWWAMNHFTMLLGIDLGWDLYADFPRARGDDPSSTTPLNWTHTRMGVYAGMIRGAWLSGRLARSNLDGYAYLYRTAQTIPITLSSGLGLMALGLRHPSMRAQIATLLAPDEGGGDEEETDVLQPRLHMLKRLISRSFGLPPEDLRRETGLRAMAFCTTVRGLNGADEASDAPSPSLALTCLSHGLWDTLNQSHGAVHIVSDVAAFALLEPEDFFVPRERFDVAFPRWSPRLAEALFAPSRAYSGERPTRAAPTPGRNEVCSCGSGKKYKRCCLGKTGA
jgi:SEC-C motif